MTHVISSFEKQQLIILWLVIMYTHYIVFMNARCVHLYFHIVICFNGSHMYACAHIVIMYGQKEHTLCTFFTNWKFFFVLNYIRRINCMYHKWIHILRNSRCSAYIENSNILFLCNFLFNNTIQNSPKFPISILSRIKKTKLGLWLQQSSKWGILFFVLNTFILNKK